MKKGQLILYFVCLTLVVELYNFIIAPHISNMLLNIVLSAICGGFCTLMIYKFIK
ncbi:hypothetical protein GCM10008918_07820 [Lactobacillus kefiranofaciens subsp. kefiranofaciens]|uniref:VanZ-like domain-containing protein n=1 Tax=Lactobacillus kefiranofaciens TaxID=267818 RepID=A0ABY0MDZ6_9LACO|nr:hypothetical protein WANG_p2031 [Lactobacillus kefiranofaciens subsp. kefiranofaciens]SDA67109.1 hypothetical protein SAMN02983011_02053 [Lactobacillus kefiranofaciens]